MGEQFEVVIGIETHVQLRAEAKLFTECPMAPESAPNTQINPIVLGMPGTLPVLNREIARAAVQVGTALGCVVQERSCFDRKHYFYPDLPKGYQITQQRRPICVDGSVDLAPEYPDRKVRIERIHIEEDAGKTIHDRDRGESRVDYNRAGTPLIEIVTGPDLRSPEEAVCYLKRLHETVLFLGASDGDLEAGNFRFDANISLRSPGAKEFGTKVELKNMNSFRFVGRALEFEVHRQSALLAAGQAVVQETRTWDEQNQRTRVTRSKEDAPDYRYMPEPDLPDLVLSSSEIKSWSETLPELPVDKRARYVREFELTEGEAQVLTGSTHIASYFETVLTRSGIPPKRASSWMSTELFALCTRENVPFENCPVGAGDFGELLLKVENRTLSGKMAKKVLEKLFLAEDSLENLIEASGSQISDTDAVRAFAQQVLHDFPEQSQMVRDGQDKVLGFLMGQLMKMSKGKANPEMARALILELLER